MKRAYLTLANQSPLPYTTSVVATDPVATPTQPRRRTMPTTTRPTPANLTWATHTADSYTTVVPKRATYWYARCGMGLAYRVYHIAPLAGVVLGSPTTPGYTLHYNGHYLATTTTLAAAQAEAEWHAVGLGGR